ncbi:hypothetical protein MRX96_046907 [Rhipicephalus microplus]
MGPPTCLTHHVPLSRGADQAPRRCPIEAQTPPSPPPRIPGANVGFLNLHGARKPRKWEELYRIITAEDISLFAVAGIHLCDLEEPPTHLDWQWAGNNRFVGDRKIGGVSVPWRRGMTWTRLPGNGQEHM